MKATCLFGLVTSTPSTKTSPDEAGSRPEPMFSNVLLPQPDGPISDTTSPSAIDRLHALDRHDDASLAAGWRSAW